MVGIRQEEKQLYSGKLLAMPFCALLYCHRSIHLRHIQIIWLPDALSEHGRNGQFVRRSYAHAAIMAIYRILYTFGEENAKYRVAVLDLGVKKNILRNFDDRDVYAKVYPAKTSYAEMEKDFKPTGYFISNGPGDPSAMPYAIDTVKEILANDKPMFGICLGHQLLALANDIPTRKMFNGHRGLNHPVKNIIINHCEVTSQNHGFGVVPEAVKASDKVEITHVNLNDQSIEGIRVKNKKAFSVQYHPESSPGPHDSRYLFDDFIKLMQ